MGRTKRKNNEERTVRPRIPDSLKRLTEVLREAAREQGIADVFATERMSLTLEEKGTLVATEHGNGRKQVTIETKHNCRGAQISKVENDFVMIELADGRTIRVDLENRLVNNLQFLN